MAQIGGVKKLRIKRLNATNEPSPSVIEKNLEPLKQNTAKKIAQESYYNSQMGISPLFRNTNKESVHQRLGVKERTFYRKKVQVVGTSTSAIMPKIRTLNRINFNKQQRVFSAQQRLNRIRANQAQQLNTMEFKPKKILRLRRTVAGGIVTQPQPMENKVRKTLRLRRTHPQVNVPEATNLTVQVKNNSFGFSHNGNNQGYNRQRFRRFKQILDMKLQEQIRAVQAQFSGGQPILHMRVTPVATAMQLNERFASYS